MAFLFKNLKVYQKGQEFYHEVASLVKGFPKGNYHIVDQINRAALSISLNIAEGNGRFHKNERNSFFRISRGSAFECVAILEVCRGQGLIPEQKHAELLDALDQISKMLTAMMK